MDIKVYNIGGSIMNNYLFETPADIIAMDTGYPGGAVKFIERFEKRWTLSKLKYIFLTHHHDDYAGFLGELLKKTEAKVILHPLAVQALAEGKNREPLGAGYSSLRGALFGKLKKDFSFPPVAIGDDRAIVVRSEEDQVFEDMGLPIRIVFLPGHTADSIGIFLPETGEIFCADAAMNVILCAARHTIWIEDKVEFGRSWDKMLALNPTKIYPSYGPLRRLPARRLPSCSGK